MTLLHSADGKPITPGNPLPVGNAGSSITGSNTYAVAQAAAAIAASTPCSMVLLQSDQNNTVDILTGGNGAQAIRLTPGQSMTIPVNNVNLIFAKLATGVAPQNLNWLAIA